MGLGAQSLRTGVMKHLGSMGESAQLDVISSKSNVSLLLEN